ncbi:MAG: putative lipoprotein [Fibrobacteres bacterium]|nr:putative lipoprotein [Fibrobacterota bacterium]
MGSSSDAALRTQGTAPDSGSGGVGKVTICHLPPGNPANAHTLSVGAPAVRAHLAHGDYLGACADKPPVDDPPVDNPPVDNPPSDDPPVGDPSGSQSAS